MKQSDTNLILCLIISIIVHSLLIIFAKGQKEPEPASLQLEQPREVMIDLIAVSLPEKAVQQSEPLAGTEQAPQQDNEIQQQPVEQPDRARPSIPEAPAAVLTPTPVPLSPDHETKPTEAPLQKQLLRHSRQLERSATEQSQEEDAAARSSGTETPSVPDTQRNRTQSNNLSQEAAAGRHRAHSAATGCARAPSGPRCPSAARGAAAPACRSPDAG